MKYFFQNFSNDQCSLNLFQGYSIQVKMARSKFQLSAHIKRKNVSLEEKMKVIDYPNKNPKMSRNCRTFQYWKDLRLKYLKERQNSLKGISIFQREYQFFKGNCKKLLHGQY